MSKMEISIVCQAIIVSLKFRRLSPKCLFYLQHYSNVSPDIFNIRIRQPSRTGPVVTLRGLGIPAFLQWRQRFYVLIFAFLPTSPLLARGLF